MYRTRTRRSARPAGFGLVEAMVGVVIALLTVLAVHRVVIASEATRRNAQSDAEAQQVAQFALARLSFDLANAGAGIVTAARALADVSRNGRFHRNDAADCRRDHQRRRTRRARQRRSSAMPSAMPPCCPRASPPPRRAVQRFRCARRWASPPATRSSSAIAAARARGRRVTVTPGRRRHARRRTTTSSRPTCPATRSRSTSGPPRAPLRRATTSPPERCEPPTCKAVTRRTRSCRTSSISRCSMASTPNGDGALDTWARGDAVERRGRLVGGAVLRAPRRSARPHQGGARRHHRARRTLRSRSDATLRLGHVRLRSRRQEHLSRAGSPARSRRARAVAGTTASTRRSCRCGIFCGTPVMPPPRARVDGARLRGRHRARGTGGHPRDGAVRRRADCAVSTPRSR